MGKFHPHKSCNYCREKGHWKADCPVLEKKVRREVKSPKSAAFEASVPSNDENCVQEKLSSNCLSVFSPSITDGYMSLVGSNEEIPIRILRDTGAIDLFILESILPFSLQSDTGDSILVRGMGMSTLTVPLHMVKLSSGLVNGEIVVGVRPALPVEGVHLILGNELAGERVWADIPVSPIVSSGNVFQQTLANVDPICVTTRAMTRNKKEIIDHPKMILNKMCSSLPIPDLSAVFFPVSADVLGGEQRSDLSLAELFDIAVQDDDVSNVARGYFVQDGMLLRKWVPHGDDIVGDPVFEVVVPTKFRKTVLEVAHDHSGHSGVRKPYDHILRYFFWPRIKCDISAYVKQCHTCQLTSKPNQKITTAPLHPIPAIGEAFEHLIIDCVGPLPSSKLGSKYLLTVMCINTRYPAAYPLRTITSRSIVKALSQFMSIFGVPKIIQSDQGTNLTSHLFQQVLKQLRVKHHLSTTYHAQSQGALGEVPPIFKVSFTGILCTV